jgi:hypothetical protein
MKKIKNKILHSVRTPLFRAKMFKDRKKESKKNGDFINEGIVPPTVSSLMMFPKTIGSVRTT